MYFVNILYDSNKMSPTPIPEYNPTWEEYKDFNLFVERLELDPIATSTGAVKVLKFRKFNSFICSIFDVFIPVVYGLPFLLR